MQRGSRAIRVVRGRLVGVVCALLLGSIGGHAYGAAALLLEEPYGHFGGMNPTGHAAVYLDHVCADTPTRLRMCRAGEFGVVISRYHRVAGYDWIAVPLVPYLYAVTAVDEIPASVDAARVLQMRDEYRREHLRRIVADAKGGGPPEGEWTQLVGSSYDRTIYGFEVETTREQDERFIALLNDRRNVSHFNLFFRNCADFSKMVLNTYYPHSIHRSFIADIGLTTPKQVARSMVKYGKKHPELEMRAFVIPQVSGSVARSRKVRGVTESLVKSKRYLVPLVVLSPHVTGGALVAYLTGGRLALPKDAEVFDLQEERVEGGSSAPVAADASTVTAGDSGGN